MARKRSPTLTEAELRLMDVLWTRGEATVSDVAGSLDDPPLAYNTVLTTLRILESKGYVDHRSIGRAFSYAPKVGRNEVRAAFIDYVISRFFDNSSKALTLQLLGDQNVDDAELSRIRELLERGEVSTADRRVASPDLRG